MKRNIFRLGLVGLVCLAAFGAAFGMTFRGAVGTAKVQMEIERSGDALTGSYYYLKSGPANRLMLAGTVAADGTFTMQESDSTGKKTGEFKGKWVDDANVSGVALEGSWVKPGMKDDGSTGFYAFEEMTYFTKVQMTTRDIKETIKPKKAEISAEYPELSGGANVAGFNAAAKSKVMSSIAGYRKDVSTLTAADIKMMGEIGSYIDISYNIEYADDDLISVNFSEGTFTGGAHPNHDTFTLNYDLKSGRELKLADLFKPGSKYIGVIAALATADLQGRKDPDSGDNLGLAQDIFEDGVKPTLENYSNWNLTKKGLEFTFPPYQVASYAEGPQSAIIPYAKLKAIALANGALARMESK